MTTFKRILRFDTSNKHGKVVSTPVIEDVEGKIIEVVEGITTFVCKVKGGYCIYEHSTGLRVGSGTTLKKAKENALSNIKMFGRTTVDKLIEDALREVGQLNFFEKEVSLRTLIEKGEGLSDKQKMFLYELLSKGTWQKTKDRLYDRIFTYGIHKNYEVYQRVIFHHDHVELVARQDYSWDLKCVRDLILHD